jgi:hypothetical protein
MAPLTSRSSARRHRRAKHGSGRPPAGVRQGECVKDYPQTSLRLPPEIKARLYAASVAAGTPQWRVASAALECFFRERSLPEQRKVFAHLSKRSRKR